MSLLDWLKRPFDTIASSAEERIKHPFIGSFMLAWLAFNWRPLLYLLVSSDTIEKKITFIEANYSSINYLLIFPLITSSIYVLALPYFSWGLDWLLQKSVSNRVRIITDNQMVRIGAKERLAIANLKKEKAEADYKDQKNTNEKISGLEKKVSELEDQNKRDRETNDKNLNELKVIHELQLSTVNDDINSLRKQSEVSKELMKEKNEQIETFKKEKENHEIRITELKQSYEKEIKQLQTNAEAFYKVVGLKDKEFDTSKKEKEAIESQFKQLKNNYDTDISTYKQNIKAAENLNKSYIEKIDLKEAEKDKLVSDLASKNALIRQLEKERDELIRLNNNNNNKTVKFEELLDKVSNPNFYTNKGMIQFEDGTIIMTQPDAKGLKFFDNSGSNFYTYAAIKERLRNIDFKWEIL